MKNSFVFRSIGVGLLAFTCSSLAQVNGGWEKLEGQKSILLSNPNGEQVTIGTVEFTPLNSESKAFKVTLAEDRMQEYFLAMRPFKCVSGTTQQYCLFPVSNEPAVISKTDLTTLEYQLMFMKTKPNALHVNPFNGLYYSLSLENNGEIRGVQKDLDMDPFITPDAVPADKKLRPVNGKDLVAADPRSSWMPEMVIR
jgi:hypothetical protein